MVLESNGYGVREEAHLVRLCVHGVWNHSWPRRHRTSARDGDDCVVIT
jgi:hypothetical protein